MDTRKNNNYHDQQNIGNVQKMREVLDTLPPFCKQFFRGISEYTSARTRLAYAYDMFFLSICMTATAIADGWISVTFL